MFEVANLSDEECTSLRELESTISARLGKEIVLIAWEHDKK